MGMDSGHWYTQDGAPCYEVPKKSGGTRGINLRWDRDLMLVPSVTTVLQVIAKPALVNWMVDQGILAALTLPREGDEKDSDYLKRVKADSKAQVIAAAEEGTRIHNAIECAFSHEEYPDTYEPSVTEVKLELGRLFSNVDDWVSEASFAHPSGYGGKVDLHSPSTGIVVDFKTKDGDFTDGKKLAYDQHYQLAAYQQGLGLPLSGCANVFVSRTHSGRVESHVWTQDEVEYGREMFNLTLALWKHVKRYDPSFQQKEGA